MGHSRHSPLRGEALSFEAGPSYLSGQPWRSGFKERRIESEPADECDGLSQGLTAVQEFKSRVSAVGHDDYAALRQPSGAAG